MRQFLPEAMAPLFDLLAEDIVRSLLAVYLLLGILIVLTVLCQACVDSGASRRHKAAIFVLDILFMAGVTWFTIDDMTEHFGDLDDGTRQCTFELRGACVLTSRYVWWLGGMLVFMILVVGLGTSILGLTMLGASGRLNGGAVQKEDIDQATNRFLLPVVVVGYLVVAARVIFGASSTGRMSETGLLDFEVWATLLLAGALGSLLQALAVVFLQHGCQLSDGAFAVAAIPAVIPFISDAWDSAKDMAFTALALQYSETETIGYVSGAVIVIVHIYLFGTREGRLELRKTFLGVFLVGAANDPIGKDEQTKSDCQEVSTACWPCGCQCKRSFWLDKPGLLLVQQTTPDRVLYFMIEDAPQGILAVVFSIAWGRISPSVIGFNIIVPLVRIVMAKLFYGWILSWGFVLRGLTRPLFEGVLPATRSWTFTQLTNAMKSNGAMKIGQEIIKAYVEVTGKGNNLVFIDFLTLLSPDLKNGEEHSDDLAALLAGLLEATATSKKLNLWSNELRDIGAVALAKAMSSKWKEVFCSLKQLRLGSNEVSDDGARALAEMLKDNATLVEMSLNYNAIGDKGAAGLGEALKENKTLRVLDLQNNMIGEAGAKSLAPALETNATLQSLILTGNKIGNAGAKALAEALETNTMLRDLWLKDSKIGGAGAVALAKALGSLAARKPGAAFKLLDLTGNKVGDSGAAAIVKALEGNTSLEKLYMADSGLGDKSAIAFAALLKGAERPKALQRLWLNGNNFGVSGKKALAEAGDAVRDRRAALELYF